MEKPRISTTEAKQDKLFYVVANVIIVDPVKKAVLLLKRGDNEKVLPGKWGVPGGKLEHDDVAALLAENSKEPIQGIDNIIGLLAKREAKEECGLDIDVTGSKIFTDKVFMRPDGIPVVLLTIACLYAGGEVVLEENAFTDFAWARLDELHNYDCIEGIDREVEMAFEVIEGST